jgi:putative hydrolase of the HAD superfamily
MNFIFDFGNVLVDFNPVEYLESLYCDKTLTKKLYKTIFASREWVKMDRGVLTRDESIEIFCKREPDLRSQIVQVMRGFNETLTPNYDTIDLLPKIKSLGHSLYFLSNMHKESRDYLLENHEYINLFDGGVFSCDVLSVKPAPAIYRYLLKKYQLAPQECIFFDDMEVNVEAAEKEGIKSILFTTAKCIECYL